MSVPETLPPLSDPSASRDQLGLGPVATVQTLDGLTIASQNMSVDRSIVPTTCSSIADLKNLDTRKYSNGSQVSVSGYYSANDGGGGTYVWNSTSTAADNGGSIIAPTGVAVGRWILQITNTINVKQFGAHGDGVSDDTIPISNLSAYIRSVGFGGEVIFPSGNYRITSTIQYTDIRGVKFIGAMGTENNNGDNTLNTRIFWDGSDSISPIFYFRRGSNNEFHNIVLDGKKTSSSTNIAESGIWIDENHTDYRYYGCKFVRCYIGVRVCSGYNHTTTAWTPGYSAFDGAYDATAASKGGYASDNHLWEGCEFDCLTAGISIESAQALDMIVTKCQFMYANSGTYGAFIAACQGITFNTATFLGAASAEIHCAYSATTGNIYVLNAHQEGGAGVLFNCPSAGADLGKGCVFQSCGGGDVRFGGTGGCVSIKNCTLSSVHVLTANVSLVIEDSTITTLDKSAGAGNGPYMRLVGSTIANTTNNWNNYDNIVVSKTALQSATDLSNVTMKLIRLGQLPQLILGPLLGSGSQQGMEGTSFSADNTGLNIGIGCYQNQSGTWIATSTFGAQVSINSTGITVNRFTGATIGASPTFITEFASNTNYGLVLPNAAADISGTPGTMYYNTSTGKIRVRDSIGWHDI